MEYSEPGSSAVSSSQSPTFYRERTGSVPAGQANYESSSSSGVGNHSRMRDRDSPPPIARSSTESSSQHPSKNYLPTVQRIRRDSTSDTREGTLEELVPTSFDESAIRILCDMDNGVQCMLDRIKQSMASCREASIFLKKRAVLEEDFGRTMHKLAATSQMAYTANECKAGSFATSWEKSMKIHEVMADNRMRFASTLNEMSEDLNNLAKEVDKSRKSTKDLHTRLERQLMDADTSYEKAKQRVELTNEELERVLVAKEGETMKDAQMSPRAGNPRRAGGLTKAVARSGLLLKGKNPGSIQRQEEDVRTRMSSASTAFEKARNEFKSLRQDYFTNQLPRIIRALKECADEIDTGMQFHLTRYAFLFETVVLNDGVTLVPNSLEDGPGLKPTMESIDNRGDFRSFVQNYRVAHAGDTPKGPRREDPREDRYIIPQHILYNDRTMAHGNGSGYRTLTFGVPLGDQMQRDQVEVPKIVVKCCDAVEKYGLNLQGIYRVSGTMTKVQELKRRVDLNIDAVNLDDDEWTQDINIVASLLKSWFRELPEPLLPPHQYHAFMEAARNDNERLRHIRMHERVNELPDPNYATLKHLMGHLNLIVQHQDQNSMDIKNIAIVFAPSLFGSPGMPGITQLANGTNPGTVGDVGLQQKAIETILEHYEDIFVEEQQNGPAF